MSIYRRGEVWWIGFTKPDGQRVRRSSETSSKQAAQELHDRLKAEAWRKGHLDEKPKYTWEDAVLQWLKEKSHKASLEKDKEIFRSVDRYLGGRRLRDIDRTLLFQILEAKEASASKATANRHMALVRAVLRRACEVWEWIDKVPKAPMFQVQTGRIRFLSSEERERLFQVLPDHLIPLVRFSLATGLRQRNACRLEWKNVDLERRCAWVHADESKNKRPIAVPLNADAMAVLRGCQGKHEGFVFTYRGKPVWWVGTKAWRRALQRAGIENFRWHDLRHSWATQHANSGTPLSVLQELGGWESPEMVRRYAHYSSAHLLTHAERIAQS